MFTGIIKALGTVTHVAATADGARLDIGAPELADTLCLGESVAVNGTCLTVATLTPPAFAFQLTSGDPLSHRPRRSDSQVIW